MRRAWQLLIRHWDDYWFRPASAANLGFCRLLFVGTVFWLYRNATFDVFATLPSALWFPHGYHAHLDVPIASAAILRVLTGAWKVSLALGAVGLLTRPSLAGAAVLSLYLLGLPHNFGKVNHADAVIVLVLAVLAMSRCGDAWSVDRLIRRLRARTEADRVRPSRSGRYGWPVRTVWLVVALIFASAGAAKLRAAGLAWVRPENLATILIQHRYYYGGMAPTDLGLAVARYPVVTTLLAAGTLAIELGMITALLSAWCRAILVPAGLLMLAGFSALLGVTFRDLAVTFLFFVPWDLAGARLLAAVRRAGLWGVRRDDRVD